MENLKFSTVIDTLKELAPLELAEDWDNVGTLIEPIQPDTKSVKRILLTNDLTEPVLCEGIEKDVQLIISYHPPIFRPFKRITQKDWKQRIAYKCIRNEIGVYSPHTALDAVSGGVNDWLIKSLDMNMTEPITQAFKTPKFSHKVIIRLPADKDDSALKDFLNNRNISYSQVTEYIIRCSESDTVSIISFLQKQLKLDTSEFVEVIEIKKHPIPNCGMGRFGFLNTPTTVSDAVEKIKTYLKLDHVRLALSNNHSLGSVINTFSVCAGSGASVLCGTSADLVLTGEMSHHEVLDFNHNGSTVILCEHSNTERGFLESFSVLLKDKLSNSSVDIMVSTADHDPLKVV